MKVIADQPISHPMANEGKVKDSAGNIPEKIGKLFNPGESFEITLDEYKAMKKSGFKLHCEDKKDEPAETIESKPADIKPNEHEENISS